MDKPSKDGANKLGIDGVDKSSTSEKDAKEAK